MSIASVTRLRLRSIRYLIPFLYRAHVSGRQAAQSAGCAGLWTRKTRGLAFWTLTVWDDEKALRAYVATSPHREAIPRLAVWCDEAAVAHWVQSSDGAPDWRSATQRLAESGRLLRVKHPSAAQAAGAKNVS
jgi:heme-degrading monooxygenase HmoA